MYSARVRTPE
jgi:hypothetical protein